MTSSAPQLPVKKIAEAIVTLRTKGSKFEIVERAVLAHAMATCDGNVSAVARLLGVDRKVIERKLARYRR